MMEFTKIHLMSHTNRVRDSTPSTHDRVSCLLHWRQLRPHVFASQQVAFQEDGFDEFSERLQIVLVTLRDPELVAVYNTSADV